MEVKSSSTKDMIDKIGKRRNRNIGWWLRGAWLKVVDTAILMVLIVMFLGRKSCSNVSRICYG